MSVPEKPVPSSSHTVSSPETLEDNGTSSKEQSTPMLDGEGNEVKMSKKAMKKAAKAERIQATKLERRAREKQMQKEKKRLKAQKRAAGELDEAEVAAELEEQERRRKRQKTSGFGGRVVLDLEFDKLMSEKEINSLTSQLAYTYSANRNAFYPFSLLCTGLDGRTRDRLEAIGDAAYKRWSHTEWWQDSYERLWTSTQAPSSSDTHESAQTGDNSIQEAEPVDGGSSKDNPGQSSKNKSGPTTASQQSIVYLTADSGEEIEELKPDETYIIGALVDHNRYKNLTLDKANAQSIRHARLPIGKYIASLPTRKVLTVNQVFEIMLRWVETRDWEVAFTSIIPQRKFLDGGKKGRKGGRGGANANADAGIAGDEDTGENDPEEADGAEEREVKDGGETVIREGDMLEVMDHDGRAETVVGITSERV